MRRLHSWIVGICSVLLFGMASVSCYTDEESLDLQSPWDLEISNVHSEISEAQRGPSVLASPKLFDLASRWSEEAAVYAGGEAVAAPSLVEYTRQHAPELVAEALVAERSMSIDLTGGPVVQNDCTCSVWGSFTASASTQTGSAWSMGARGAAHDARIYQAVSGGSSERTAIPATTSTKFRTRIVCRSTAGAPCSAGCSAQLYADAYYSSKLRAEAHVWTIWSRAGTTQVVDGVTLNLQQPYRADVRLAEKAASVQHSTNGGSYDPAQLATVVANGLAIYLALDSGASVPGNLIAPTVRALFGLINSATSNNNGSYEAGMKMEFESYFDSQPIQLQYQSNTNLVYGLELSSKASMKVRGYGYHSETGELKSSYALATYIDNFSCAAGVTPPQRAGFWSYDAYSGAPMSAANLQDELRSFFLMGYGAAPDLTASTGTLVQGVCGNNICESLESPNNCSADCGYCGNGVCSQVFETATSCQADCGYCGDGICGGNEDTSSCLVDCGYCGDGVCAPNELSDCPHDCGFNCSPDILCPLGS